MHFKVLEEAILFYLNWHREARQSQRNFETKAVSWVSPDVAPGYRSMSVGSKKSQVKSWQLGPGI